MTSKELIERTIAALLEGMGVTEILWPSTKSAYPDFAFPLVNDNPAD